MTVITPKDLMYLNETISKLYAFLKEQNIPEDDALFTALRTIQNSFVSCREDS